MFQKTETPREIQERNDLYKIALGLSFRDIRTSTALMNTRTAMRTTTNDNVSSTTEGSIIAHHIKYNQSTKELERIFDKAHDALEEKKVYDKSIRALRREVQQLMRPQVSSLLNVFKDTEGMIPSTTRLESESEDHILMREANKKRCCDVLYDEQCQTLDLLEHYNSDCEILTKGGEEQDEGGNPDQKAANRKRRQMPFLNKKLSAIQSIASFYQWEHFYSDNSHGEGENDLLSPNNNGADEFGYIQSTDAQVNNSIRYYQMINLSRSALIRQKIGYSVISLKSTLPNAGRGIFVDGTAPAGSILAFFPGDVWPKEYLINSSALAPYFKKDPRYLLSIRYDDILIDSRKSPYTVLDDLDSNAFAVAHIVNHPSNLDEPNCSTMAVDFIADMKLAEAGVDRFVPNTYKKKPMLFGPQAMDQDIVMMHSMGLLASRDVENEELFYDYRLSPGPDKSFPDWYHIINEEESKNRWHHDSTQ